MDQHSSKRFKTNCAFNLNECSVPPSISKSLDLIANNFNDCRIRNLEIMDTSENRLYALMTNYDSHNFCWIHPTRTRTMTTVVEYDSYIRRINKDAKKDKLVTIENPSVGEDCVVRYNQDGCWYRGIVAGEPINNQWLVFFPDYGNSQLSPTYQIASPVDDVDCSHYQAPIQAVCCRLYNIVPRLPNLRTEIDARLEEFYSNNSDRFLEVKVRNVRSDFIVDCDLFTPDEEQPGELRFFRKHIGQSLVEDDLATFADPCAAHCVKIKEGK